MEEMESKDLAERLNLIEGMLAEGRRSTQSWGWTFVLWGVAYYFATAWATWGKSNYAWPVTMTVAGIITAVRATRGMRRSPRTNLSRAIAAMWQAMGISLMVLLMSLAWSGRYDGHVFVAIVGAMLATANGASAIVLRWREQLGCALAWLAASVIACFGSDQATGYAFLGATFLCQIVFGIYAMICESRRRRQTGVAHA